MWIKKPENAEGAELVNIAACHAINTENVKYTTGAEETPMITFYVSTESEGAWVFRTKEERDIAFEDLMYRMISQ